MDRERIEQALVAIEEQIAAIRIAIGAQDPPMTKRPAKAQAIPKEWQPHPDDLAWAKTSHPTMDTTHETDCFRDHFTANAKPYRDWRAAWRNWIRRSAKFSPAPVATLQVRSIGRAAALSESNRVKRDRALDKLAALEQGAAAREIPGEGQGGAGPAAADDYGLLAAGYQRSSDPFD